LTIILIHDLIYSLLQLSGFSEVVEMYVCLCKGVTDSQIRSAVREGARTVRGLRKQLGCTGQCGKCKQQVRELRDEVLFEQGMMLAPVPSPA
jgi:bacterioferritin-associated ferredoxin